MILGRHTSSKVRFARALSIRASDVLQSLGLPTSGELNGVYDGQWKGSGEIIHSICPTTGETLARVKTASPEDLRTALHKSREAYNGFRSMKLCFTF